MAKDIKAKDELPTSARGNKGDRQVADFIDALARAPAAAPAGSRGRLIFAIDATASREPTWDIACDIQAEMFEATDGLGGLDVQLVFYRGFGECRASGWVSNSRDLVNRMLKVRCLGGRTQIRKILRHAVRETEKERVGALVFVGDSCEENIDALCDQAGRLGLLGVKTFMFHEGADPHAAAAFRHIAQLTGGAYCPFDVGSARQLKDLLSAVAVYAAGGRRALEDYGRARGGAALQITQQIK